MSFQDHCYERLLEAILAIDDATADDIYAISFFIYTKDDDPRMPTLTLGYNTNAHWQQSISQAFDADEAKWNYAFWTQDCIASIGEEDDAPLVKAWIQSLGLWYEDEEEEDDDSFERVMDLGADMTDAFIELAISTAMRLHTDGIIVKKFNKEIPILIHEFEYYDDIAEQTERANPPGCAQEFVTWVDNLGEYDGQDDDDEDDDAE